MKDNIISKIKSLITRESMAPEVEAKVDVKYAVAAPTNETARFLGRQRNAGLLKTYRTIYTEGGIYTVAINTYPDFILANGYHFESNDPVLLEFVEQWATNFNLYEILYDGIVDSLVYGDAYDELIYSKNHSVLGLSGRQSWLFETTYDKYNVVQGYRQFTDGFNSAVSIPPDRIFHLRLLGMAGMPFGISLIGNAYDEILRDTEIAEAASTAIKRHGLPIWHVQVGVTGEVVPDAVLDDLEAKFTDIQSKHELITQRDVTITSLNTGGIAGLDSIQKFSVERVLSAMGIPMEALGLGSTSSTFATASVTLESFMYRVQRMRRTVEYSFNTQVLNKVVGINGAVRIVLDSPKVDGTLEEEVKE